MPEGQLFDPEWLVALIHAQEPNPALEAEVAKYTRAIKESDAYFHFVDPAEQTGYEFDHNVALLDREHGMVVLDVWRDGRVGGVEFPDRVKA